MSTLLLKAVVWAWVVGLGVLAAGFLIYGAGNAAIFEAPALMALAMGALIVTRVRGNLVGAVMLIGGSAWLLYAVGYDYARLSLESGSLPGEFIAAWLGAWAGPLFYLSFPTLLLLFPDGRASGFRRWFMIVIVGVGLLTVAGAISLWGVPPEVIVDEPTLSIDPRYQLTDLAFVFSLWLTLPATYAIVSRYRTGDHVVRQQVKWLLFGALALAGSLTLAPLLEQSDFWGIALAIGMSLFPIGVGIAVFKYRLYELGRIVSRTVSYALVVAVLGAVFMFGVVYIPNQLLLVQDPPAILVAASTLAAAALFNPLRRWAQGWVDRRFNRSRYDAERVMDGFADSLRHQLDSSDVIDGWVEVVEETMQPATIGVWVRS
jgi:hypothetical protein